jgi:acyl dehydratase
MIEIHDIAALRQRIGEEIAVSDWLEVTQERIAQFADATDDHYWIHVDPVRASTESPFRSTIAHGFLTLSLTTILLASTLDFPDVRMAINYGCNRVRFVSPVPAGSRIRARIAPLAIDEVTGGVQVNWSVVIEREGGTKPACLVEWLVRYYR